MRIKMLSVAAGPEGVFRVGAVREVAEAIGKEMVERGFAEQLPEIPGAESRSVETPEKSDSGIEMRDDLKLEELKKADPEEKEAEEVREKKKSKR